MSSAEPRFARRTRQVGFTLLEAVVALVILTSTSLALYGLFNNNLLTLGKVQTTTRVVPLAKEASRYLAALNLTQPGEGEFELDGARVLWSARLAEPHRQSQNVRGFLGYFQIGLYDVEFSIIEREKTLGTFQIRLVGYEKVREPAR